MKNNCFPVQKEFCEKSGVVYIFVNFFNVWLSRIENVVFCWLQHYVSRLWKIPMYIYDRITTKGQITLWNY